ncbi:MAG TPA: hypothetical protein VGH33_10805 [Isosphaeraceae bacterium]
MTTRLTSPARAILWEYLARHPLLDFGIIAGLAGMVALAHLLPESWRTSAAGVVADEGMPLVIFPVMVFFFEIIALFGVTPNSQRSGPSGYPARMFRYPVPTARLVAWPMLFGAVAMALGWVAVAVLVLPGFGLRPPLGLGALGAAATLACLQAFSWWPFGTSLAMVVAVCVVPAVLIGLILWPMYVWGWGPGVAWALLPIYLVAAYAVAVRGVALDRRGDGRGGRGWLTVFEGIERLAEIIPGARSRFASAARAQLWLEWRSKGAVIFLVAAAMTLFVTVFFVVLPLPEEKPAVCLVFMLVQPLLICGIMGAIFAKDEMRSRTAEMSPFLATRPMSSAALADAKLRGAALVLVVSCGFAVAAAAAWALAIGRLGPIATGFAALAHTRGAVALVATLGPALVLILSWKGMVGAMLPVLTGRSWVTNALGAIFTVMMLLVVAVILLFAPQLGAVFAEAKQILAGKIPPPRLLFTAVPMALGLMLGLKLALSTLAYRAAVVRGLISRREAIGPVLLWAAATASLMTLAALIFRPSSLTQWLTLAMVSAVAPPLGRTPAATLALDWGRHR